MFRIQDNVPEVYILLSRDFQLLARLYDVLISGVKYDIDSIINILDASTVRDSMLSLLSTKVGFFTEELIDAQVLKYIVASFPYIIKYKGTRKGIELAVETILRSEATDNATVRPLVRIINKTTNTKDAPYTVHIYTRVSILNRVALRELLKYVLPVGYAYKLEKYDLLTDGQLFTQFTQTDRAAIIKSDIRVTSSVRGSTDFIASSTKNNANYNKYQSAYDVSEVVSATVANSSTSEYNVDYQTLEEVSD